MVTDLRAALRDESPGTRFYAARTLSNIGCCGSASVRVLIERLQHTDEDQVRYAVVALKRAGFDGRSRVFGSAGASPRP